MRLLLLRHGRTACSVADVYCGRGCGVELDRLGLRCAEAAAARLAGLRPARLLSSPLPRAVMTAGPIARASRLEIELEPALEELDYGAWDGLGRAQLEATQAERYRAWLADPLAHAPPGGETAGQVAERVLAVVDLLRLQQHTGPVCLVSHKSSLRILICALLEIPLRDYRRRIDQPLAGLSELELGPEGARLLRLGDVAHLQAPA